MVGEIRHERIHRLEPSRIDHRTAVAARGNEACVAQAVQMKCQCAGRQSKAGADMTGRHPARAGLDQQAEYVEAAVLRQSRQNGDGILFFHISIFIEMIASGQETGPADAPVAKPATCHRNKIIMAVCVIHLTQIGRSPALDCSHSGSRRGTSPRNDAIAREATLQKSMVSAYGRTSFALEQILVETGLVGSNLTLRALEFAQN